MDDKIEYKGMSIIRGGVVQLHIHNKTRGQTYHVDVNPVEFFNSLGKEMQDGMVYYFIRQEQEEG